MEVTTTAKVAGGVILGGTGTGVAGYGTYKYLTYETIRNLIEKENLKVLSKDDDWTEIATGYLVGLTEEANLANKIDDLNETISADDDDSKLNSKRDKFKDKCLELLGKEATEENKTAYLEKVKAWCIKFESYKDQMQKESSGYKLAEKNDSSWSNKYDGLIVTDNGVKVLLEAKKGSNENKKAEIAHWWCSLEIHKKYDSSKYSDFKTKCLTVIAS